MRFLDLFFTFFGIFGPLTQSEPFEDGLVDVLVEGLVCVLSCLGYGVLMTLRDEDVESVVLASDVVVLPLGVSDGSIASRNMASPLLCYMVCYEVCYTV